MTIVRVGSTGNYADNFDKAFGKKSSGPKKAEKKAAAKPAKAAAKKKPAKKAAKKKSAGKS